MSLQDAAIALANGVCAAYAAYNNGSNLTPQLPGYNSFNQIWVFQSVPNVVPWPLTAAEEALKSAVSAKRVTVPYEPAAYATDGSPPLCIGPEPLGTPWPGSQLFGFTATSNTAPYHNIFVLRGTVTMEEAGYDLFGWGSKTACLLPSQNSEQQSFGLVNGDLYDFYVYNNFGVVTSLAASCMSAIQATNKQAPGLPWLMGSHSLGGAILSLAAFDAVVSKAIPAEKLLAMTFGSLHVGDGSFAAYYNNWVPASGRVANLCDFVPSLVSIAPVIPKDPYIHVGIPGTFVWQKWDDWKNHNLANIYMKMVNCHWDLIKWGERNYPQ
jgi:hypothetical protein